MEGSSAVNWRTSSYSGSNGGQCVGVATSDRVLVRDTKNRSGAVLAFGPNAWREFAARVKDDRAV